MQIAYGTHDNDWIRRARLQTGWLRGISRPRGERSHGHVFVEKLWSGGEVDGEGKGAVDLFKRNNGSAVALC